MNEVPDPNILQDPAMDDDDIIDDHRRRGDNSSDDGGGGNSDDDDYDDNDDDYDPDAYGDDVDADGTAAQVLFGNRDNNRRRGGRGGGRRGGRRGRGRNNQPDDDEEEEDGEDLMDNAMKDYQPIAALDTYGTEDIDNRQYDDMNVDQRYAAEAVLQARDKERNRMSAIVGGRARGFYGALDAMEEDLEEEEERMRRRAMFGRSGRGGGDGDDGDGGDDDDDEDELDDDNFEDEEGVNLEAFDVPLREWIAQDRTRREIQRKFRMFLSTFREGEEFDEDIDDSLLDEAERKRRKRLLAQTPPTYEDRIRQMCSVNKSALELSYLHLMQKEPTLALWVNEAPRDMLDVLNEAATRHTLRLFPSYYTIRDEIHVRISDVPIVDSLRDLRRAHLDGLVKVSGVITRRSGVFPQLKLAYYDCIKCKSIMGPPRHAIITYSVCTNIFEDN